MTDKKTDKDFFSALGIIKGELKTKLLNLPYDIQENTAEIRLRVGKPVILCGTYGIFVLSLNGEVVTKSNTPFVCYSEDINSIFSRLCAFSVHSHIQSIINGFRTYTAQQALFHNSHRGVRHQPSLPPHRLRAERWSCRPDQ